MCDLCGNDQKLRAEARNKQSRYADKLEGLAAKLRLVASGRIDPHVPEAEIISRLARQAIRFLAEEWIG